MNLIVNFTKNGGEIELKLLNGKRLIDTLDFSFQGNLDDLLISSVDKIFKRNRIETPSKNVNIEGDIDKNSSAHNIAFAFCEAWKKAYKW